MQTLIRISVVILAILFTPLAFVLCMAQLFEFQAMYSFGHIVAFWVAMVILRLCLTQPPRNQIIFRTHPNDRPK